MTGPDEYHDKTDARRGMQLYQRYCAYRSPGLLGDTFVRLSRCSRDGHQVAEALNIPTDVQLALIAALRIESSPGEVSGSRPELGDAGRPRIAILLDAT